VLYHCSRTSSSEGSEDEEEILGSDDDEQEDPKDYCKGSKEVSRAIYCHRHHHHLRAVNNVSVCLRRRLPSS